jgi:hypothetical protein
MHPPAGLPLAANGRAVMIGELDGSVHDRVGRNDRP